jgi:hypothetical protein
MAKAFTINQTFLDLREEYPRNTRAGLALAKEEG